MEQDKDSKIHIYNTLGRELQEFVPIDKNEVKVYHCGPTVYWDQHIGNMRAAIISDIVKRSIEYNKDENGNNYKVTLVRNYTDVGHLTGDNIGDADTGEDRMDKAVRRDNKSPKQIADFYIDRYLIDIGLLNANSANRMPRATAYIKQIIAMVSELLDKGFAYTTSQGVYFNVAKYPEYTRLSGQKLDLQNAGTGHGDVSDNQKINTADFALWIFKIGKHEDALQTWDSPFGIGFPGWHIECSAMSKDILGNHFDIHMGGIEHIPVHHTNEIAQSESVNGEKYVNYWLHNEHLLINNKKMSKSEGTAYLLSDVINYLNLTQPLPPPAPSQGKDYNTKIQASTLRYFFLQAHYRSKQNFTWEALLASYTSFIKLRRHYQNSKIDLLENINIIKENLSLKNQYENKFLKAINNDFNTAQALAVLWTLIKDKDLGTTDKIYLIEDFNKVFGLELN